MNFNNFTIKSQEAIQKAVNEARRSGNQAIEPAHLMKGILGEGGSVIKFIFQKLSVNENFIDQQLNKEIATFPKVSNAEPYLSSASNEALDKAIDFAQKNGDEYVTLEVMLMGLFKSNNSV